MTFGESSQGGRLGRVDHQRILGKGMWWWLGWLRVTEMVPASTWPAMRKNSFLKNCTCQHGHPQRKFHQIPDPPFHTLILTPVSESSFLMTLLLFKLLPLYRGLRVRKSVCEPFQSRLWISHGPLVLPDISRVGFQSQMFSSTQVQVPQAGEPHRGLDLSALRGNLSDCGSPPISG